MPTPSLPLPEPLRGREPGSFARDTIERRLVEIAAEDETPLDLCS